MAKSRSVGTSIITSKARTVIPKAVRDRLGLKPGDTVRYRMTAAGIVIEKQAVAEDDPFATFSEWAGDADARAYDTL